MLLPRIGRELLRPQRLLKPLSAACMFQSVQQKSSAAQYDRPLRRRRRKGRLDEDSPEPAATIGLSSPFASKEATSDQYLKKASMSPWVPTPDPVARKMLEVAKADSSDIHVDLGSGDGRICFHASDPPFSVEQSIGIDIDEKLLEIANDRLSKRHPAPNMEFIQADLENEQVYSTIQNASVVTMYFVTDALKRIQPHIVETFKERDVRIVTCGYAMPGWEPQWVEVILGLPVYLYKLRANEEIPQAKNLGEDYDDDEELNPIVQDEDDGIERIGLPLYDPDEKLDWEKLYEEDSDDPNEPSIWWQNPKE